MTKPSPPAGDIEETFTIACRDQALVAVLHRPDAPSRRGVLVIVGGPQYRVGSHRQFVSLGRALAREGFPVLRFDYRGMGDSVGDAVAFDKSAPDITAAVDAFFQRIDDLEEVVLWGLCDAASASCLHAYRDPRIVGQVLVNPWVTNDARQAQVVLRHYYLQRVASTGFWKELFSGQLQLGQSVSSFMGNLSKSVVSQFGRYLNPFRKGFDELLDQMLDGLALYRGAVLVILSGEDLTATEFHAAVRGDTRWRRLLQDERVAVRQLENADHTFSKPQWKDQVEEWTAAWLRSW